jgi:hypothetical protein
MKLVAAGVLAGPVIAFALMYVVLMYGSDVVVAW